MAENPVELDADLLEMSLDELTAENEAEIQRWKSMITMVPEQIIQVPSFDTHAQLMGIHLALVDAGLLTSEQINAAFLRFKITQMRLIRGQHLPEIQRQQARAKIAPVGGPNGIQLPPGIRM